MKRSFKQQAKHAQKIILEQNKKKHEDFMQHNFPDNTESQKETKAKSHKKLWISLTSSIAVALTAIICLIVFLPTFFPHEPKKHYLVENEKFQEISLTELNTRLKNISLSINELYETRIEHVYDSESNDTLYFKLQLINEEETSERIFIDIYVNVDYDNRKELTEKTEDKLLGGLTIKYFRSIVEDDWANTIQYNAVTSYLNTEIFINYEQLSLDDHSNFFAFFEQTIKKI